MRQLVAGLVVIAGFIALPANADTGFISCDSISYRYQYCPVQTQGRVIMVHENSTGNLCRQGRGWGYDDNGIWVDRGCRAEFQIADNSGTYRQRGPSQAMQTFTCESQSAQRTYCRADTRFGVRVLRQLSRNDCIANRTWGSDANGVWVSGGCRAEFAMNPRR